MMTTAITLEGLMASLCLFSILFFFSSRRRHTRCLSDWSSDVCSSDLELLLIFGSWVIAPGDTGSDDPAAKDQQQFGQEDEPDQRADRQIARKAAAQLSEIDIEHHHNKEEQHRDRADIDDDEDHREELGPHQHKEPGRVEESEEPEQHR